MEWAKVPLKSSTYDGTQKNLQTLTKNVYP